jgi:hypothetical protein
MATPGGLGGLGGGLVFERFFREVSPRFNRFLSGARWFLVINRFRRDASKLLVVQKPYLEKKGETTRL